MITHKDQAFCTRSDFCSATECHRHISRKEQEKATLPIAWADFKTSDCGYVPKDNDEYNNQNWN